MRALVQRVNYAKVEVDGKIVGKINNGLLLFVGFTEKDSSKEIDWMINRIVNLRIYEDENGVMNKSLKEVGGSILSVSQFTLYADASNGNRPSYIKALKGEKAILLYNEFNEKLSNTGIHIETGIFGADMKVSLLNDGPISIILEK